MMVEPNERRKHLFDVTDAAGEAHTEWSDSDTPYITEPFQLAVDDMIEVFSSGDIPADCRALNKAVEALTDLWEAWKKKADISGESTILPSQDCWLALERVAAARQQAVPRQPVILETIEELDKQKVPDRQICIMYEWLLENGSPDFDKLREERATPGTHTGADFVPPQERRRLKLEAQQKAAIARARHRREQKLEKLKAKAPESIEDLIAEGVSAEQIAGMKDCSVEDVFAAADAAEMERPMEYYAPIQTERGTHGPPINEATERAMDADVAGKRRAAKSKKPWEKAEVIESSEDQPDVPDVPDDSGSSVSIAMTIEQQIISLHKNGSRPTEIAAALTTGEIVISRQKVNAVIKRFQKQPEAFAAVGT